MISSKNTSSLFTHYYINFDRSLIERSIAKLMMSIQYWRIQFDRARQNLELFRISKLRRHETFITTVFGCPFIANDSLNFIWSYQKIVLQGVYAFRSKRDNPTILDIGAHTGLSVLYFKDIYPKSKVIAFEPDREFFDLLSKNLHDAGHDDVALINAPLSSDDVHLMFTGKDTGIQEEDIKITNLRDYLTEPIDLLKINLEGHEIMILSDILAHLSYVDHLFIEYYAFVSEPQYLEELISLLNKAGFLFYIQQAEEPDPQPFLNTKNYLSHDIQFNIFAFRD
jgi:FkbM family methyltransferase